MLDKRLNVPWRALRLSFGAVLIIAGMDKFTNLLADWTQYLSPMLDQLLPISASMFMQLVGVVEIAMGLFVLTPFTRIGAYVISTWLAAIAINLVTTGRFFDVAVRDLVMAVGAFTLGRLTEARERSARPRLVRAPTFSGSGDESRQSYPVFQQEQSASTSSGTKLRSEATPPHEVL